MTPLPTSLETRIKVLKETIAWFKKHIEPHDCQHIGRIIHLGISILS